MVLLPLLLPVAGNSMAVVGGHGALPVVDAVHLHVNSPKRLGQRHHLIPVK